MQVRFSDVDGMGHVNNAVYFTYIEAARTEYLYKLTGTERVEKVDWIVASASLNFREAVAYGDPLDVKVKPTRIGATSFTLVYEIWNGAKKEIVADGETVIVMFDYSRREKKPISPTLRERLERDAAL
jgi:acyl-CoA thioester hydrolase